MSIKFKFTCVLLLGLFFARPLHAQPWSSEQQEVIDAIEQLSASTAPDGGGADAYGQMLTDDFSRWTLGSSLINNKTDWVDGIRKWFDEGWRVTDRKVAFVELAINNDLAFTRRNVVETYLAPDGDRSTSKAAVAEMWIRINGKWLLFRANVCPITE